ncbi:YeeE/YedE family integral membrane protein-like protein [Cenococcum geophilum]
MSTVRLGFKRRLIQNPPQTVPFFAGMATSFLPLKIFLPEPPLPSALPSVIVIVGVGALTGIGAKISNGCTYGHMLCRPSRLSGRSSIAVTTFLPVAMITRHLVHPPKRRLLSARTAAQFLSGLVILFGVAPNLIEIRLRGFSNPPSLNTRFELPTKTIKDTDYWKFVLGVAVFGVGWGMTGTCPGLAFGWECACKKHLNS